MRKNTNNFNKKLKIGQAAQRLNVSSSTLRGYANRGEIPYSTTPKGQRVFDIDDLDKFLGIEIQEVHAFYTRSSKGSAMSHKNQKNQLESAFGNTDLIYKDNGSGLSESRRGLERLFRDAKKGKFNVVYVTHADRLTRFGFSYIEKLLQEYNVEIRVLYNDIQTVEDELMSDLMNLIASFSGRYYRMRSKENQYKILDKAKEVLDNEEKNK